ncbi:MAG: hypothetical protein M1837_004839 [Sclerophora amabilis]|nr:MAG: hypothetical protein M1837_004839 [Sclerophora amabilis]
MAANDYYNYTPSPHRPNVDFNAPLPPTPLSTNQRPAESSHNQSSIPVESSPLGDHLYSSNPYHIRDSRQSLASDSPYHGTTTGGAYGQDPYADNIPLKPQASTFSPQQLDGQNTKPYPTGLEGGVAGSSGVPNRKKKRRHWLLPSKGPKPWFVYVMTVIQISVFIAEIVKNSVLTKSPIMIHPQFNPMIGPSTSVLINMGARFVPCMRNTHGIQDADEIPTFLCPNSTSTDNLCPLSDICGFSGVPNPTKDSDLTTKPQPNQWYRFIIPMFLHAGVIHIGFNMVLQLLLGSELERVIGPLRFAIVYFSSGIFGFVLGGNFAPDGIPSMGASGCLFGVLALVLLDLLYTWNERKSPGKDLAFIVLDIVISFVLGLLPGLDNFSHIGGFLMGLVLGVCLLHSPNSLRQKIAPGETPYQPVTHPRSSTDSMTGFKDFTKHPFGFFKGRKPLWWAWWLLRAGALMGVLIAFIVLLDNFYKYQHECKWCKYLSCLPVSNWCELGNLTAPPEKRPQLNKRNFLAPLLTNAIPALL